MDNATDEQGERGREGGKGILRFRHARDFQAEGVGRGDGARLTSRGTELDLLRG